MSTGVFLLMVVIALIAAVIVAVALAHYNRKKTIELHGDLGYLGDFDDLDDFGNEGFFDQDDDRAAPARTAEKHGDQQAATG